MTAAITAALVAGLFTVLGAPLLLRSLPTPADEPCSPYLALATSRVSCWMGAVVAALVWLILRQPATTWPAGLVLATVGAIAVCIDELTCWLPKALTHTGTALTLAALAAAWAAGLSPTPVVVRALLAGLALRSFFWVVWRLARAMGFGDVRLSLLCGITAGQVSWQAFYAAALLGTLLPLVEALTTHRGHRQIPYGPGLLLGSTMAVVLLAR